MNKSRLAKLKEAQDIHRQHIEKAQRVSITHYWRVRDCQDDLFLIEDPKQPYIGAIFELTPFVLAGHDLVKLCKEAIGYLDEGDVVQSMILSLPNSAESIHSWEESRSNRFPKIAQKRAQFLLDRCLKVPLSGGGNVAQKQVLLCLKTPIKNEDAFTKERVRSSFNDKLQVFKGALGDVHPKQIGYSELSRSMYSLLNIQEFNHHPDTLKNRKSISKPVLCSRSTEVTHQKEAIYFSNAQSEVVCLPLTIEELPEDIRPQFVGELMGDIKLPIDALKYPYMMYFNFVVESDDKLNRYRLRGQAIQRQDFSSISANLFKDMRDWNTNINAFLNTVKKEKLKPVAGYLGMNVFCEPDEKKDVLSELKKRCNGLRTKLCEEPLIALPVFLNSLPFGFSPHEEKRLLKRSLDMHSLNAATLLMLQGGHMKTPAIAGGVPFLSRHNGFAPFNFREAGGDNTNMVILGGSGSGKSFFTNDLVNGFFTQYPNSLVRIFDSGGSYSAQCELLKGSSVTFDPNNVLSLNPFWGITPELFETMIDFCRVAISAMAGIDGRDKSQPAIEQRSYIDTAIRKAYQKAGLKLGSIDIIEAIKELPKANKRINQSTINTMLNILNKYGREGSLSGYMNGEPEIDLNNPFMYLELDDLSGNEDLRTTILTLLTGIISKEMYSTPASVPKLILFDEAWEILKDPLVQPVISALYRKARKYGGSVGIISQNITDIDDFVAMKEAFGNAEFKFFLRQRDAIQRLAAKDKKALGEGELIYDIFDSFKSPKDTGFSDVIVSFGQGTHVSRFYVDPFSYLCYTSDSRDKATIQQVMADNQIDKLKAIELMTTN